MCAAQKLYKKRSRRLIFLFALVLFDSSCIFGFIHSKNFGYLHELLAQALWITRTKERVAILPPCRKIESNLPFPVLTQDNVLLQPEQSHGS
jgi:hypothetical protein